MVRRTREDTARTRRVIVDRAVDTASVAGLEGLTLGGLAEDVGMSKSGLVGHFGSREALQLATLAAAIDRFVAEVWQPAAASPAGLPRLRSLCAAWISYLERDVFPGGCFLTAAATELDDRPGPLRDAVAAALSRWLTALAREAAVARDAGDLPADTDPEQIAFELNAAFMAANQAHRLGTDARWTERVRVAVGRVLGPVPVGGG
jgi:AcrR family transcriptional regulator